MECASGIRLTTSLLGWLLGTQNAKAPMWMVIIANTVNNIVLDLCIRYRFWLESRRGSIGLSDR